MSISTTVNPASGGVGITELTGEVLAGPGGGSEAATINPAGTPEVARLGVGAPADATAALWVVGQIVNPLVDDGLGGATLTIDWNDGNKHLVTLDANVTLTLSNPEDGGAYVIKLLQDASGTNTVTWPATVRWPGNVTPTITATADHWDIVTLFYDANDTTYTASINQDYQ